MSRIRTIKPEFPQSSTLGSVSRDARLCAVSLLTVADDEGRLAANLRVLAGQLYPFDDDARDLLESWLSELERIGFIRRYTVEEKPYIHITEWAKHQKIDRPSKSRLPPPPERATNLDGSARHRDPAMGLVEVSTNPREDSMGAREASEKAGESAPSGQRGLDAGPRTMDQGPKTGDQGPETEDRNSSRKRPAAAARHLSADDLAAEGVARSVAADWLVVRKVALTETAWNAVKREAARAGIDVGNAVRIAAEKGWRGFDADWLKGGEGTGGHKAMGQTDAEQSAAKAARIAASLGFSQLSASAVVALAPAEEGHHDA